MKDIGFGLVILAVNVIYALHIFAILASEEQIYDTKTGSTVVELVELFFMLLFILEIVLYLASYGPKLYFRDVLNFVDIVLIAATIVLYVLDIVNSDKYRSKGAFRAIRVALMLFRLRFSFLLYFARKRIINTLYEAQVPLAQV